MNLTFNTGDFWQRAIALNKSGLIKVLAMMLDLACMHSGSNYKNLPISLPREATYAILRLLLPAESAARRWIAIVAHTSLKLDQSKADTTPCNAAKLDFSKFQSSGNARAPACLLSA